MSKSYTNPTFAADRCNDYNWYRLGSNHSQVFMVCLGDGSVRGLRKNIDQTPWVLLGAKSDGFVINFE